MADITDLISFTGNGSGTNGGSPSGSLILDGQGNLYGTTSKGGANGVGTVFQIARTGTDLSGAPAYATTPTVLVSFNGTNGDFPADSLIADAQGNLYGTTSGGGANDSGTVFEIVHTGTNLAGAPSYDPSPKTLVSFKTNASSGPSGSTEADPIGSLIADAKGDLYGTTRFGGTTGNGSVFEIAHIGTSPSGAPVYDTTPITVVSFTGGNGNGSNGGVPNGSLIADSQGNLYGTTSRGGTNGAGTVFEVARTGKNAAGFPTYAAAPTVLFSFGGSGPGTNGGDPFGDLVADAQGNLYGTTAAGGASGAGTVFELARTGTNAAGAPTYASSPTTLASFDGDGGGTNGGAPVGNLIIDARGNLFGTTAAGGANGFGTVFEIARTGTDAAGAPTYSPVVDTLVAFDDTNGQDPAGSLIADSRGNLYGTTATGGANGAGTVFEVTNSGFVTCFRTGTRIRTPRGDVAVEALAVGDRVVTASGKARSVRWIGHRTIDCRSHPRSGDVHPIRVAPHAFGRDLPERELFLSPGHPVLVGADEDGNGGHLVPIMCLINGTTIARVPVDTVTYWHVELDEHDILLAEGLPAESYLDWGDRAFFHRGRRPRARQPRLRRPRPSRPLPPRRARRAGRRGRAAPARCGLRDGPGRGVRVARSRGRRALHRCDGWSDARRARPHLVDGGRSEQPHGLSRRN